MKLAFISFCLLLSVGLNSVSAHAKNDVFFRSPNAPLVPNKWGRFNPGKAVGNYDPYFINKIRMGLLDSCLRHVTNSNDCQEVFFRTAEAVFSYNMPSCGRFMQCDLDFTAADAGAANIYLDYMGIAYAKALKDLGFCPGGARVTPRLWRRFLSVGRGFHSDLMIQALEKSTGKNDEWLQCVR